jgi:hypothetical protein
MSTVTLVFPAALLPSYSLQDPSGLPLTLTPTNGTVTVDARLTAALLAVGFTPARLTGTTAARPTIALYPGLPYLDTTLNKPIWRNGGNTGWIDATGSAV